MRGQNQGEFGEQVNILNKELLRQRIENGMCSFLLKHKVAKILGPVSCSTAAVLCCFGNFVDTVPSAYEFTLRFDIT